MKAVIMAGGKGTRLLPLTKNIPKPMVPLIDRPVMAYILDLLVAHGITEIIVTLGHLPEAIPSYFGDGKRFGVHLHYAKEESPMGTAGGVRGIAGLLDDTFLVLSGDGLTDANLSAAMEAHQRQKAWVTLVLQTVECPYGYGVVEVDNCGYVKQFVEKPMTWAADRTYLVNTGIYVMEPNVMSCIPTDQPYDFGKQLFPTLLAKGAPMFGYEDSGYWSDIGTLRQYYRSQLDILDGRVHIQTPSSATLGSNPPTLLKEAALL